ncbi:inositol monophosphatase family protein [Helicobacter sp. 11S02596-1]|uniref:inositol monophosphatase family protein n=1 Tax=Helicobacter sp. 11S02596-1 TaxID=1476194 RepID=UPI000BA7A080|nr:inositol monophosphatase family protein [Helicobacter sp. 11S02596-1]PAF42345.1 hypothetical protein BJI48_06950 [Helicobacter sp. 11S02596-1]
MSDFIKAVIEASQHIIEILSQRKPEHMQAHQIGAGGDISLGADLLSEEIFAKYLLPIANIDSEESGYLVGKGDDVIILDPLDGSDNYISNIPYYGASVALCASSGETKEAIIINFCSQSAYFDTGDGVFFTKIPARTTAPITPKQSLSKCGIFEKAYSNPDIAKKLFEHSIKFRSLGASALSLAYAQESNFMLFGGKIRKYDAQAGLFLSRHLWINHCEDFLLVSRNKQIFDMISKIIKKD